MAAFSDAESNSSGGSPIPRPTRDGFGQGETAGSANAPSPAGSLASPAATERPVVPPIQLLPVERASTPLGGRSSGAGRFAASVGAPGAAGEAAQTGWGPAVGFLLVLAGVILAVASGERWTSLTGWAGEPWTSDACRWLLSGILMIGGVSFLSAKPIAVLFTSAIILLAVHCVDLLVAGRLTAIIETVADAGAGPRLMVIAAVALGYLTHMFGGPTTSARGAVALAFIGFAGVGVIHDWYERGLLAVAPSLGTDATDFVGQWGDECTWAVALILAAIGVALSRGRLVHFLAALMLAAIAYYCIQSGRTVIVSFPGSEIAIPDIETVGLANVTRWRWVAAGELMLLGLILLHLSLGVGGLNLVFAFAWMFAGLAAYDEVGKLSLARLVSQGVAQHQASQTQRVSTNPMGMWGLPLTDPSSGQARQADVGRSSSQAAVGRIAPESASRARPDGPASVRAGAQELAETELLVSGVAPVVWIYLTALLAGVIGVTGIRMLLESNVHRALLLMALWFVVGLGSAWLAMHWPRDAGQSWVQWLAAFGTTRYHGHLIWLVFVACMAVAGLWALWLSRSASPWIHASVYCIFLGTILSLVAVAGLIRYGGFPRLPVWTYIALAAGQSSQAWVLMMHVSLSGEKVPRKV